MMKPKCKLDLENELFHFIFFSCLLVHSEIFLYSNIEKLDNLFEILQLSLEISFKEETKKQTKEKYKKYIKNIYADNKYKFGMDEFHKSCWYLFFCIIIDCKRNASKIIQDELAEKIEDTLEDSNEKEYDINPNFYKKLVPSSIAPHLNKIIIKQFFMVVWTIIGDYDYRQAKINLSEKTAKDKDEIEIVFRHKDRGYVKKSYNKAWCVYSFYKKRIKELSKERHLEVEKELLFTCLFYMFYDLLGYNLNSISFNTDGIFNNNLKWMELLNTNYPFNDNGCPSKTDAMEYGKKILNELAGYIYKRERDIMSSEDLKKLPNDHERTVIMTNQITIPVTDVTKEAIEASINDYVNINPFSALAVALSAGIHINIEKIDNINKTITIVFDFAWGKDLPDDAYDEMSEAYNSGCIDSVEEYVKKLHFIHGCNPSDITECLDQIISEAESDDEECMACFIYDAEEFVENVLVKESIAV